jgi:hypothetical protein
MALDPVTALLDIGGKVIDRLFPDPAQKAAAQLELFKLQQQGELSQMVGQMEINKAEAASGSAFASSWRPAIGWVCALALMAQYVARPMVQWAGLITGHQWPPLPGIDDNLWELMLGMLGLGGLRTYERVKGVTPPGR